MELIKVTLVVGLSIGALPAFMGDLLTSWKIPTTVDLPTRPEQAVHPVGNGLHAAKLAQKLIIVRPYLMIAWAGEQSEAHRIIRELDECCPDHASGLKDPHLVLKILDSCKEGVEMVALLIYRGQINPICIRTRSFEIDSQNLYVLGSGTEDFISSLQEYAPVDWANERCDGLLARATLLRFAGRAMATQWIGGLGLDNAWGGGFEVVYPDQEVGGFRNVDNIMFRAWKIDSDGSYSTSGRSFYARYYGNDLHLSWFSTDEKTYVIPSPLASAKPVIPEYERNHPEWTLDLFLVSDVPTFVELARYQPLNRPVAEWVEMKDGALVGWSMDRAYVDKCAELAVANSKQGAIFKTMNY